MMKKKPEWYDVLEPRAAVIAGVVGLAVVWSLTHYAYHGGYVSKNLGTAIDMLSFAVPYWFVKWSSTR